MKDTIIRCFFVCFAVISTMFMSSCTEDRQQQTYESPVAGKDTIYVEDVLYPYFLEAKPKYDSVFENAEITLIPVNARRGMSLLFSDTASCVILARDYLRDEDSIVKSMSLPFQKIEIAKDGLVFFVSKDIPIDTMNLSQLEGMLSGTSINAIQKKVVFDEALCIPSMQSSEYAGLLKYFSKGNSALSSTFKQYENRDSLKAQVRRSKSIGIGLMSDILKDSTLKAIRIGYTDSTGKRVAPQIVHPGFIVQNMYPLVLPIFAYVKNEKKDLAWGFATFMEKDPSIQKVLLNKGIIPSHAKYNLIQEE
jgi:ABC-type phosphate transport system substrate-binding protein